MFYIGCPQGFEPELREVGGSRSPPSSCLPSAPRTQLPNPLPRSLYGPRRSCKGGGGARRGDPRAGEEPGAGSSALWPPGGNVATSSSRKSPGRFSFACKAARLREFRLWLNKFGSVLTRTRSSCVWTEISVFWPFLRAQALGKCVHRGCGCGGLCARGPGITRRVPVRTSLRTHGTGGHKNTAHKCGL